MLTVTFFVTLAYVVVKLLKDAAGKTDEGTSGQVITVLPLLLLVLAVVHVFPTRKAAEPPKWMGSLETATRKVSFRFGVLSLAVFPDRHHHLDLCRHPPGA